MCDFLFTPALDGAKHSEIYDDTYWKDQDPDWYGRVAETLRLLMLSNELLHKRCEDLEILDFGCGIGGFLDIGRRSLGLNVWGTDIIQPKVGKEYFLPELGDRKFDVITACEVIEHLPNPLEQFREIRRHLKIPGAFAFQTAEWDPHSGSRDWWYLGPQNGHISLFSRRALDFAFNALAAKTRRIYLDYPGVQAWLFE